MITPRRNWLIACLLLVLPMVGTVGFARYAHGQNGTDTGSGFLTASLPTEFYLVLVFCCLGLLVLIMQFALFWRAPERISAGDVMRSFSTTLILVSVVALVGVGYSEKQVQPAMSVIATLIGYLMGRGTLAGDLPSSRLRRKSSDTLEPDEN